VTNNKIDKRLLNLAGKHRVCSELNKLNVRATVTYEKRNSGDVHAIRKNRTALKIEVRASQEDRFLTRIDENRPAVLPAPNFWVLVQFQPRGERFFVLSNEEICALQREVNGKYMKAHPRTNPKGVPGMKVEDVKDHEGAWKKIIEGNPQNSQRSRTTPFVVQPFLQRHRPKRSWVPRLSARHGKRQP
jgi:hypothetical protein